MALALSPQRVRSLCKHGGARIKRLAAPSCPHSIWWTHGALPEEETEGESGAGAVSGGKAGAGSAGAREYPVRCPQCSELFWKNLRKDFQRL